MSSPRNSDDFLRSPLVIWIQSYLDAPISSNADLTNGVLLNKVLTLIDPTVFSGLRLQNAGIDDITSRAHNLAEVLHSIKRYYLEKLQQIVILKIPDILMLAKEPNNELSYSEMNTILLLMLGCAIQCEKKEEFIEHIKELTVDVQRGLVASIQEITENAQNVIPYRVNELPELSQEDLVSLSESLYYQLQNVLEQRDDYVEAMLDLALVHENGEEMDMIEESPRFRPRHPLSPRTSFRSTNILQANRQRLQSMQSELDDRHGLVNELKEEIEQMKLLLDNIRLENKQLVNEAGWAKSYRDELDILKLQLENTTKIQIENVKLKEKVRDMEFYKKSFLEMKEQSDALYESKLVLEEKVAGSNSKISRFAHLEEENNRLYSQVKLLMEEREEDQHKIRDLVDEVAKLSIEKQESLSACSVMNAELDGLKMQKQDDGLNVPLLIEYNQSTSTDIMRLERENKHLMTLIENLRNTTSDVRLKELQDDNTKLSASLLDYKNMITKLTKALLSTDGKTTKFKSLLSERNSNRELDAVIGSQKDNIKNLRGTLTKRASELEQTNAELESLANELAVKGVVVDPSVLKDALLNEDVCNGPYFARDKKSMNGERPAAILSLEKQVKEAKVSNIKLKEDLALKDEELTTLETKVRQVETYGKKVEEQLRQREKDINELDRRFETKITENKTLSQNDIIHQDKIAALEERVAHLMSSASEDTRKINKSLEQKLQRISELETKLLRVDDEMKKHQRIEGQLKKKAKQHDELQKVVETRDEQTRELEIQFEKAKITCTKLEHSVKLKDEQIATLTSSVDELSTNANTKQSERIELLMKSLDTRGNDITELEDKVADLIHLNNKLKSSNRSKNDQVQSLEDRISELEGQLDGKNYQQVLDDRVKVLNKQLTEREGQIDELEVKLDEVNNNVNKSNRTIQHRDEKIMSLEQKLQDFEELTHQMDRLSHMLDDRSKKILDLEMKLDNLQNDNSKLNRTLAQKEEEFATATKSLGTLEDSITDQSSLSKLIQLKDAKINSLNITLDEKDVNIVKLEDELSGSDGKVKKLTHALKLREEKVTELEKTLNKFEELEAKNTKFLSTVEQKDKKIQDLENSLDHLNELTRSNNRFKESLQSKDDKICTLEGRIDDLQEAVRMNERLNQQVKQKEERITLLQERVDQLETHIHKLEQQGYKIKQSAESEIHKLSVENQELNEVKVKRQMSIMRREKKIVNLETKLNEYATEKEEKENKIQDLQAKLEGTMSKLGLTTGNKDKRLLEMEQRVKELQNTYHENRNLSSALARKDEEILEIRKQINELDVNNNRNSNLLEDKEESIKDLQERLQETLGLNNRLNYSVKKQEEKLKSLESDLQQNYIKLEKLSVDCENKERMIERNKERQEEMKKQLLAKEEEIIDLDKQMSALKTGEVEKNRLLLTLKEKDALITNLEEKMQTLPKVNNSNNNYIKALREKEVELEALQKKANDHASERHKTKLHLQEKDGELADLKRRIEELQLTASGSDKLNNIVKEKNSQITILRQSLDEFQSHTAQLETKLEEMQSQQTRSTHAIKMGEDRLQSLKSQLEDYVNKSHNLTNDLQMKEEKLKSLTKSLMEMTERNKDLEEDINMLEKDLQELKKTGSLKNITNITEKIQLTKRARTELHIQRGPPKSLSQQAQRIEIKMSPNKHDAQAQEAIEKLQESLDLLEKQKSRLTDQIEQLSSENAAILCKNETLKSDYDLLKADYEGVQKEMNEAREHFQELDVSATKIAHRCEVLVQLNATLEEENRALMDQVNKLLAQNQDLLMTTLHSRDQYIDDERTFTDHIYELERAKEKLSEKVLAAERALQGSGNKKKGVLWRGTRKILKKAGLAKKRESGTFSPEYDQTIFSDGSVSPASTPTRPKFTSYDTVQPTVQSPLGPIRDLLSRSRQDISQIDNSIVLRRATMLDYSGSSASDASNRYAISSKPRPKSEFYTSAFSRVDYESPVSERRQLHRPRSMENIKAQEALDIEDDCDIIPLDRKESNPIDKKISLPVERKDSTRSRTSQKLSSRSNPNSTPTTPTVLRKSSGQNTPIQKVRVTQITTPQVMKASPETINLDYTPRQELDSSPRSNRKLPRASTFTSTPVSRKENMYGTDEIEPLAFSRSNSLRSERRRSDQNRSFESSDDNKSVTSGSFSRRSNEDKRRVNRSESFSPPANATPFGSREQRSSFRRYEIEQMEPRLLPRSRASDSDNEEGKVNQVPPPRPPKMSVAERSSESFNANDQRGSLRKIQRGNPDATAQQDGQTELQRKDSEKKKNPKWYEYGSV